MSKKWIVVDLDGTLCDCAHRVHLAQAKQWDEFHAGIPEDKLRIDVASIVHGMSTFYGILLCTGRNERHRIATEEWLYEHGIGSVVDHLLMRPDDSRAPDHELKPAMVYEFFGSEEEAKQKVFLVLDDRDKVVEAWRDHGFTCWQVQAGSY